MKETTPKAMPPCFEKWCQRFDEAFSHKAQKTGFRNYLGGLLGESERKNLSQMADNAIGVEYHKLHHFLTEAPWFQLPSLTSTGVSPHKRWWQIYLSPSQCGFKRICSK